MKLSPAILLTAAVLITGALASAFYLRDYEEFEPPAPDSESSSSAPRGASSSQVKSRPSGSEARSGSRKQNPVDIQMPSMPLPEIKSTRSPQPAVADSQAAPSREELARRVQLIQKTSDARLAKLTRDLNLTEEQQHKVFAILARSSPAYHPSLQIGIPVPKADGGGDSGKLRVLEPDAPSGADKPGVEDQIFETLDPDQADLLAEQILERDQWWNDIVGLLERDIDSTLLREIDPVAKPPAAAPVAPAGDTPSNSADENRETTVPQNHGGGNLFDRPSGR